MAPPSKPTRDTWSERSTALADLLSRVALGDRAAFSALYKASSAHLFAVILRINPDRAQAEDLLQDIFINIWRAAQGYDADRAQAMTWLTSIARNRAIDSLRRRKSEVSTVSDIGGAGDDEPESDLLDRQPSPLPGPLEQLLEAAQARQVVQCIQGLSTEQQQCVALTYYQGLTHAEVAGHLAQPLGTVKSWVRRALLSLKDCLTRSSTPMNTAA
jgi:RNA polymerase sigma factor (sigma-70 family)